MTMDIIEICDLKDTIEAYLDIYDESFFIDLSLDNLQFLPLMVVLEDFNWSFIEGGILEIKGRM